MLRLTRSKPTHLSSPIPGLSRYSSTMDPEESRDSLFDSGNIEDAAGIKQPAPAVIASLTPIKAPLEDSAKDAAREDPRKKLPAYTEADVDAVLESDSGEIEHGAELRKASMRMSRAVPEFACPAPIP